jgi:dienelactone hydrolase
MASLWYPAEVVADAELGRLSDLLAPRIEESLLLLAEKSGLDEVQHEAVFHKLRSIAWRAQRDVAPQSGGPFPVLIYYPGGQGHRFTNAGLCEALASFGYVVLALDAPRDAPIVVFPGGQIVLQGMADDEDYIWPRVADVQFLLDQLPDLNASVFGGQLDLERIGMFGASRGGYLSNICAVQDSRVKAAINMDGFLWGLWCEGTGLDRYPLEFQQRARSFTTPVLRLLGDQDGADKARAKFEQERVDFGGPFILAALHGWSHGDFGQMPWLSGAIETIGTNAERVAAPEASQERLLAMVKEFFDIYLARAESAPPLTALQQNDIDLFWKE